jgi:hypothetical protein
MQSTIGMDHNLLGVKLVAGFHLETQFGYVSRQFEGDIFPYSVGEEIQWFKSIGLLGV